MNASNLIPPLRKKRQHFVINSLFLTDKKNGTITATTADPVDHNKMHSDHVHEDVNKRDFFLLFLFYVNM